MTVTLSWKTPKTRPALYQGRRVILYQPFPYQGKGPHLESVYVQDGHRIRRLNYGHQRYQQNRSKAQWQRYIKRSALIKNGKGRLTTNDPTSANFWARVRLWPNRWNVRTLRTQTGHTIRTKK